MRLEHIISATLDWPPNCNSLGPPIPRQTTPFTALVQRFKSEDWVGAGRHRAVFQRGRVVVKVPLSQAGIQDNQLEARRWRERAHPHLARCRLAGPLLVMERVSTRSQNPPEWADTIDCSQVGLNRKGRWVAYDYAQRLMWDPST
jgi:hypothetical protein